MTNRKKLVIRGVFFAYGAVITQVIYSFASIPLALAHLSKAEFGMWALASAVIGYLMLAEMGMQNSATRHLLECKNVKDSSKYGRLFIGSAAALGGIAVLVAALGLLFSAFAWRFFPIPSELVQSFIYLMLGMTLVQTLTMATQILGIPLYVHHRQDLSHICQIGLFVVYYVVLRYGLHAGWGVFALLANTAAGLLWSITFRIIACCKLGFYPARSSWSLPHREEWSSVWNYSKNVFVIQVGQLVLSSIPQLTIAKLLGLEAGAVWAVCTRPFAILKQVVGRPFGVVLPVIYETYINGDMRGVVTRWVDISQLVLGVAGVVFSVASVNNARFVELWTHGRIHWDEANNWLLALYFITFTASTLASGCLGIEKKVGKARFAGLIQAPLTVLLAIPMAKWLGIPGLILAISIPYGPGLIMVGVRYLAGITKHKTGPLLWQGILRPALVTPLCALAAWTCTWTADWLPGYLGLILSASLGTFLAMACMMSLGVSPGVRSKMFSLASKALSRFVPTMAARP